MKVHFITSRITQENNIDMLRRVVSSIEKTGHVLADNWLEEAYSREVSQDKALIDWQAIFKTNIANIAKADVVVAEATYDSFAIGYQVAAAIQQKKPVLILRKSGAERNAFVSGVDENLAKREEYTDESLDEIISKFLSDNDIATKDMRFNFFIDRAIYNYLRWAALKTGKTKAEILRELVQREIETKDY